MNGTDFYEPRVDLSDTPGTSPILRSWARCHQQRDLPDEPVMLARVDLADRCAQHASLLYAAQPEIETLAGLVGSAAGIVVLTDAAGIILQTRGNADFLHRADQVALRPGVSWAESHRGTNGVGTVLVEGQALSVHGSEHFLPRNRILSCHGAPIRSPRGDILGVLDISCEAGRLHAYALKLASMFARQVTNRIMEQAGEQPELLVFHRQHAMLDSIERAQLMIHDGHIVGANDAAIAQLDTSWTQLIDQPVQAWLGDGWQQAAPDTCTLRTPRGMPLFIQLRRPASGMASPRQQDQGPLRRSEQSDPHMAHLPRQGHHKDVAMAARHGLPGSHALPDLPDMLRAGFGTALRALQGGLAVLLEGETGTGKEVYARRLHASSTRSNQPFIAINCGALPDTLIEAELFGYAAGAFTGALRQGARGRLREANGGILFLDEIGDMPLPLQTRLLRVLQEREVLPLGADKSVPVDFLLISATNQDLAQRVQDGQFRADLYYRLQDHRIGLPALRERSDLRAFLCAEFNRHGALEQGMTLHDSTLDALCAHRWPGNYRELQALLRGLVLRHPPGSLVMAEGLPDGFQPTSWPHGMVAQPATDTHTLPRHAASDHSPQATLHALSAQRIRQALHEHSGNISRAARSLGIHRSTLHRYLARDANPALSSNPYA
ncbi:MAG: sigma-54-dependent Fis family transcriptional regulator [Corticimicrobacter sp.]|uniref:sigma-54-dependent Fis family transcriptional regulator n=1 Tax=Corticimicrobacter sp. TaxID=2678536 RepID=UPI0032D9D200